MVSGAKISNISETAKKNATKMQHFSCISNIYLIPI
nr:MAG TPA: hypothetical protein [Bacteriophage sp.]